MKGRRQLYCIYYFSLIRLILASALKNLCVSNLHHSLLSLVVNIIKYSITVFSFFESSKSSIYLTEILDEVGMLFLTIFTRGCWQPIFKKRNFCRFPVISRQTAERLHATELRPLLSPDLRGGAWYCLNLMCQSFLTPHWRP